MLSCFVFLTLLFFVESSNVTWSRFDGRLPYHQYSSQAIGYNDLYIYLFGGLQDLSYPINSIFKWDRQLPMTWTTITTKIPTNQFWASNTNYVTVGKNLTYFIGMETDEVYNGQVYIFNMNTEQFVKHNIPNSLPITGGCVCSDGKNIFVIGGAYNTGHVTNQMQILNIATEQWSKQQIPINITGSSCIAINNKVYSFGGLAVITTPLLINTVYSYDITNHSWKKVSNLTQTRQDSFAILSPKKDNVFIIGGWIYAKTIPHIRTTETVDVFDVNNECVLANQTSYLPIGTAVFPAAIFNSSIMTFGGYADAASRSPEIYISNKITSE